MNHPQGKTSEMVERLRAVSHYPVGDRSKDTLDQAASELTRLEAEVGKLRDRLAHWDRAAEKLEYGLRDRGGWPTGQSKLVAAAFENVRQQTASLLSRLQSGSENKDLAGVPGDLASASGVFSPESEAGDSAPHHTKGEREPGLDYRPSAQCLAEIEAIENFQRESMMRLRDIVVGSTTSHDHTKGGA